MSETRKQRPIPNVPEDEGDMALALERAQNQIKKALHPTVGDGQLRTETMIGAPGGCMYRSNVSTVHNGDNVTLIFQSGCTNEDFEHIKRRLRDLETSNFPRRSAQTLQSPAPVTSKKHDSESGDANTDERIAGVLHAYHDNGSAMTDDELYVHLHQCDVSDVSEEDIQSLTDEEVFYHLVSVLACCNITPSEELYDSDTLGIKMRVKAGQHIHKKEDPLNVLTEETIPDVKLKSSIKVEIGPGTRERTNLMVVNSEKLMEDCTTAEG
ncbi:uncharacterized protein LOC124253303 [Haliotis rubra]|uniref:uncharacterized protein LOC124253303 n=1 Tax=Haliotis rubra TaxID=36100 RepID=UPI001EE5AD81|nr:uncharacterized protein LOC124253303 [Haliotis rubra]